MPDHIKKENTRSGILICGAYGMQNAGDEAILEAIVSEMRSIDPDMDITVLSRTPEATAKKHGVKSLHMFDVPGFLRVMNSCSLYINGGGSLIQDATSSRSLWYYLYTIAAAKKRGCRVLMYGCGIGPVSRPMNRKLTSLIIDKNVDEITLREESSLRELESFGVKRPRISVACDPALTLKRASDTEIDEKMREIGLEPDGKYICFCLRSWEGFEGKLECFAAAADYAYESRGLTPVFLSVNTRSDGTAAQKAAKYMKHPHIVAEEPLSTALMMGIISRMQAVLSIRLHGLIFAAGQSVPIVGIAYDPKVSAFLEYIGQKNYIPLSEVSEENLKKMIDAALSADRNEICERTERIRNIEGLNVQAALRLLGKEKE